MIHLHRFHISPLHLRDIERVVKTRAPAFFEEIVHQPRKGTRDSVRRNITHPKNELSIV